MEFIILTIIFCFYVLYNEIHKRRIKNEKKEFKIPKEFYENLKDAINYIDYSLELIKQKQENINKVYIKLMELKKDLEDKQTKKRSKKTITTNNHKVDPKIPLEQKSENSEEELEINSSFLTKILDNLEEDKIDFSFQKEKPMISPTLSNSNYQKNQTFIQQIGSFFRKTFNLPEIPVTIPIATTTEPITLDKIEKPTSTQKPITLEEFEKNITSKEKEEPTQQRSIKETINPKDVLIQETKKLFLELRTQEEKVKFVHKLFELGFTEDEIYLITELPNAEILLISKLKSKKEK